ncbi:Alpha-2-macroglobulin [Holothuria leucospilota]|uniref:Alpha-2-macroglobulin n=1 Tax=Holothuria leucospilota TaxID=206669 RepID=A0A9Q1H8D7_HOLLE|nr:Alpha-2-macroglobulin [Holothuria leucospilota]
MLQRFTASLSYSSDDEASNMAIIDFRLQSGYTADKISLDHLMETNTLLKRYEVDGKSVMFYFDKINSKATCVTFHLIQSIKVKEIKPSFVTVYDYYKTDVKRTVTYSLICSIQIDRFQPQTQTWGSLGLEEQTVENVCPPKLGTCPSSENITCENEQFAHNCTDDTQCPGERKCCMEGCSQICIYPDFPLCCPICEDELPEDWESKFCHSHYAAVMKVKARSRAKLFQNYRFGEDTLGMVVQYTLDDQCGCELELNQRYIVFTDYESIDEDQREISIRETSLIVRFKKKYLKKLKAITCLIA